ncbi:MAG: hypothetical protein DLM69_08720 [Candidatus Chloroheliales bacterium]|nr:MAG: hypothetical protein DLM69_08720 [Chloroflexota bacterium]
MRIIDTQAVYDDLLTDLRRLERRLRWQEAIRGLPIAVGAGLALGALAAVAARIWPVYTRTQVWQLIGGLVALTLALNFIFAFLRPRPRIEIARRIDQALNLNERLSTAVDAHNRRAQGTMVALQAADAAHAAGSADIRHAFPIRIARRDLTFTVALSVLLLLAMFAPNPLEAAARQREAVKATQQNVADKIQQVQHEIEQAPNADDPVRQQLLTEIEALRHDLANGNLSREQALARMQQTEENLKKLQDPASLAEKEALNRLGQELGKFTDPAIQAIANNLQLGNFQDAAQGLHDLANNIPSLRPDQLTNLQAAMSQAAQALANVDPTLAAKLQRVADALKKGDLNAARQALDDAAGQVANAAQSIAAQQQLQQALAQVQNGEQAVAQAGQPTPAPAGTAVAGGNNSANNPAKSGNQAGNQANAAGTPQPGQKGGTPQPGNPQPGNNPQSGSQGGSQSGNQGSSPDKSGTPSASQGGSGGSLGGGDRIYAPEPIQNPNSGTPLPIGSNNGNGSGSGKPIGSGSGGAGSGAGPGQSAGSSGGNGSVPYPQVYKQYSDKATSDLQNSYIPQNLKGYVRDYFTSLAPPQ